MTERRHPQDPAPILELIRLPDLLEDLPDFVANVRGVRALNNKLPNLALFSVRSYLIIPLAVKTVTAYEDFG